MTEDASSAFLKLSANAAGLLCLTCILHIGSGADKDALQPFTETRWEKFKQCARERLKTADDCDTDADIASRHTDLLDKAFTDVPKSYGFHPDCYRRFIDKKRITSAANRASKSGTKRSISAIEKDITSVIGSPKRLRSKASLKMAASQHVLQKLCIICKKVEKFTTVTDKRQKDKLAQAETENAGQMYSLLSIKRSNNKRLGLIKS